MTSILPSPRYLDGLASKVATLDDATLPPDVIAMAKLCLLDWIGVTLAAVREPMIEILVADALEDGGEGRATIVGRKERVGTLQALLINGTAGHALDYDDSNPAVMGHPSICLAPVVLGLGEARRMSGRDVLTAFVAGYETMAGVAQLMTKSHYRRGFHGTATMGTFGATAAAARLLGLNAEATRHALGIAGTRTGGVRASFGTMCKPLHAGNAAFVGASSARMAARGFTGASDIFADPRGFAATHGSDFDEDAADVTPPGGYHILGNLFKWHAACHLTHGPIDAVGALRDRHGLVPDNIRRIRLRVPPFVEGVCDIPTPASGLEIKFSLRMVTALALAGVDTASPASFSDANAADAALGRLRDVVEVEIDPAMASGGWASIETTDGAIVEQGADPAATDIGSADRARLVTNKFLALASPVLGSGPAAAIAEAVARLDGLSDVTPLLALTVPRADVALKQEKAA